MILIKLEDNEDCYYVNPNLIEYCIPGKLTYRNYYLTIVLVTNKITLHTDEWEKVEEWLKKLEEKE